MLLCLSAALVLHSALVKLCMLLALKTIAVLDCLPFRRQSLQNNKHVSACHCNHTAVSKLSPPHEFWTSSGAQQMYTYTES